MPSTFRICVFAFYCLGLPSILLAEHPNIIFLLADDQRPDTIAALGNPIIQTPNLDRLVREGSTFTQATCANPLCVPSRAEILTGQSGFRNGVHMPPLKPNLEHTTWPQAMQQIGYNTFWVGKWMIAGRPSTRGYQESLGLFASGGKQTKPQFDYAGREVTGYRSWVFQTDDRQTFPEKGVGLTPDIESKFADAAIEFINREHTKPFFLHVNFTAPHDPLLMPPGWENVYDAKRMPLPKNFKSVHPFDHGNLKGRDELLNTFPRRKTDIKRDLSTYYAVISYMDQQIGRILKALDDTNQTQNTIVIFSSDHGLALGSHGLMGKQNMYEHTINVPLIFRGPGIPEGKQFSAQCYLRDLYPTFMDITEQPYNPSIEGTSLMPVIRGEIEAAYPFIIGYFRDSQRMIRMRNWKLIDYPQADHVQLFHLGTDPHELKNLAFNKKYSGIAEQLREEMNTWLQNHGDPLAR